MHTHVVGFVMPWLISCFVFVLFGFVVLLLFYVVFFLARVRYPLIGETVGPFGSQNSSRHNQHCHNYIACVLIRLW